VREIDVKAILDKLRKEGVREGAWSISRFKGLGEMNPGQLRETTMDPKTRGMLRVTLPQEYEERAGVKDLVERLMGKNPEHRFTFIQENAARVDENVIDA
jgi:topoisomerase-4 subunit B